LRILAVDGDDAAWFKGCILIDNGVNVVEEVYPSRRICVWRYGDERVGTTEGEEAAS
jgi:hypothetical protein